MSLTNGQLMVGLTFNPGNNQEVTDCKQSFANEIDRMLEVHNFSGGEEKKRLAKVAVEKIQEAQMAAVKAITWDDAVLETSPFR